jgi:hypothetical protein
MKPAEVAQLKIPMTLPAVEPRHYEQKHNVKKKYTKLKVRMQQYDMT